jgi:hypothetical protein
MQSRSFVPVFFFNILPCHENFHDKLGRQQDHLGASDFLLPHF